jgi:hypothetical protein
MNSKQNGGYFQFPIRTLRVGCRLDAVTREQACQVFGDALKYALWVRTVDYAHDADESVMAMASKYLDRYPCEDSDDAEDETVWAAAAACEVLNVKVSLSKKWVEQWGETWQRIEKIPGSNMLVRVRRDLMWEFRDSWAFRDAALLCGVFAGIGNAKYRQLTYERIQTLASGYASDAELKQHGPRMLPMLSTRMVSHWLGKLQQRGLFQAETPNGRHRFYSHSLSGVDFIEVMAQRVAKRGRRAADGRAAIQARAKEILGGLPADADAK